MSIIKILQYPDSRLKTIGKPVEKVDEHIRKIIADMFETHYNAHNCAALAATQLDIPNPPRITVIDFSEKKNKPLCLINPEIIETRGEQKEQEGCMSVAVPHYQDQEEDQYSVFENVTRAMFIRVRAMNAEGKWFEMEAEGFMAKCIQHEIDHLNGILFIDRLSQLKKRRLVDKLSKARKEAERHK